MEEDEEELDEEGKTLYLAPEEGEMLMIKRLLHATDAPSEASKREQIFHSRCKVANKTDNLIIDGGSCTNVASIELVNKLNLATLAHLRPHKLQWLKKGNEVTVTKKVLVAFSFGSYKDKAVCDVLPMDACHLLLSKPW